MRTLDRSGVQVAFAAIMLAGQTFADGVRSQAATSERHPAIAGQRTPGHGPAFEVISIKPSGKNTGVSIARTPDGFSATHQSVTALILLGYLPMPLWNGDRVRHGPDWANKQEFDILAKVAPEDIAAWQGHAGSKLQMEMLQSMLADRFQLVLHTEPSEMSGFALVVTKPRPGLKVAAPDESLPKAGMTLSAGGVAVGGRTKESPGWTFYAAPMASLAGLLSQFSHTIIEDRTGLTGAYDFDLRRRDDADPYDHGDITNPATRWDLEGLGLRTIPSKVQSFNFIIDHLEKPSPN